MTSEITHDDSIKVGASRYFVKKDIYGREIVDGKREVVCQDCANQYGSNCPLFNADIDINLTQDYCSRFEFK